MARIGDEVIVYKQNLNRNRAEVEGHAVVVGKTAHPDWYLIHFYGQNKPSLRKIDPVAQLIEPATFLLLANIGLAELSAASMQTGQVM